MVEIPNSQTTARGHEPGRMGHAGSRALFGSETAVVLTSPHASNSDNASNALQYSDIV